MKPRQTEILKPFPGSFTEKLRNYLRPAVVRQAFASACLAIMMGGCVAYSTHDGLQPISPETHQSFRKPVLVDSLHPEFRWKTATPGQAVDLILWDGGNDPNVKHLKMKVAYLKENIVGGSHTLQTNLQPDTIYYWSIKPSGTVKWSTETQRFILSATPYTPGLHEVEQGFFMLRTPKQ